MKPMSWWVMCAVLWIAVGWTGRLVAERGVFGDRRHGASADECATRSESCPSRRLGPLLGSVLAYADELNLEEARLAELERLRDETARRVDAQRAAVDAVLHQSAVEVRQILDEDEYRTLLDLIGQHWSQYRERKLRKMVSWLEVETGLAVDAVAAVEAILMDHSADVAAWFQRLFLEESWPTRDEIDVFLTESSQQRDHRLAEFFSEAELQRFRDASRRWSAESR